VTLTVRLKDDRSVPFDDLPVGAAFRIGNEAFVKIDHSVIHHTPPVVRAAAELAREIQTQINGDH
jgi:hypothetical protein